MIIEVQKPPFCQTDVSSLVLKFFFLGGVRWELLTNKYINYDSL